MNQATVLVVLNTYQKYRNVFENITYGDLKEITDKVNELLNDGE